jgi:hypothetical protein
VSRVSREKDPSTTVALSNEQMWIPGIRNQDLEWERTFRETVNQRGVCAVQMSRSFCAIIVTCEV